MSIEQRYETQMLLSVSGYLPAVANDQFNQRICEAIVNFQAENGFAVTSILTSAEIGRLRLIANPILTYWRLTMVRHPVVGLPLWIPVGVRLKQISTRRGLDFENRNKTVAVSFDFFRNGDLEAAYGRLLNRPGFRAGYNILKDDFFVVVAESESATAYSRYHEIADGIVGFTLAWKHDEAVHGDRLATVMSDLFRANVGLGLNRAPPVPSAAAPLTRTPPDEKEQETQASGSGFFVSPEGHVITSAHVVEGCPTVRTTFGFAPGMAGRILIRDVVNDLALIKVETRPTAFASLRRGIRLGEDVAAYGFPLAGLLEARGNFTRGNITALTGLGNDTRVLQISAPIQLGSSGGPLLDHSGNVVGVVQGKLNATKFAEAFNDLPQNVNFAIKASVVTIFLEANKVDYASGSLGAIPLSSADLAEGAKSISVFIECRKTITVN